MTAHADLDPDTGALLVSWRGWLAMRSQHGQDGDDQEAIGALADVGAAYEGRLDSPLQRAMLAVHEPLAQFRLTRRGMEAPGWLDHEAALMLVPRGPDLFEPAVAAVDFLCDLLGRLVDLGPRAVSDSPPVKISSATLASAIASEGSPEADTGLPDVLDYWELDLKGTQADSRRIRIEVLDTDQGWWQVAPDGHDVAARPCATTTVWRQLSAAVDSIASTERTL